MKRHRLSLSTAIFLRVFLLSCVIILIGLLIVWQLTYSFIVDNISGQRQELLHQTASSLNMVRSVVGTTSDSAVQLMEASLVEHGGEEDLLTEGDLVLAFRDLVQNMGQLGFGISINVVMNNGISFSSEPEYSDDLEKFITSYWFMSMEQGVRDEAWGMRIIEPELLDVIVLSHSRAVKNAEGDTVGILLVNVEQKTLYETYSKLISANNRIHIIDEDGVAISYSNLRMIGFDLYDMDTFADVVAPFNTSTIRKTQRGSVLFTNYRAPESGWTIIEEMDLSQLFAPYGSIIATVVSIISAALLISLVNALRMSRSTTRRLARLAGQMSSFNEKSPSHDSFAIQPQDYAEVYMLGVGYNKMLSNIEQLIQEVRREEFERRENEFRFLQAQINPHFLHNTLLTIKGLLALDRRADAAEMLDAFVHLVRIPVSARQPLIPLADEIDSVSGYIRIMEYRYGHSFHFGADVEKGLEKMPVIQLLLQPIVENSIFHGFATLKGDMWIRLSVFREDGRVLVVLEDNGVGMTQEQIQTLWLQPDAQKHGFNHVSMKNIRDRLLHIYKGGADIEVQSVPDLGTQVIIALPGRKEAVEPDENPSG